MKTNTAETPVPFDREIWITANILMPDALGATVEPYEGRGHWDGSDWLDDRGLSIRQWDDAKINILEWQELAERAAGAPESELMLSSHIDHRGGEFAREMNREGFFASVVVYHTPTMVRMREEEMGPFQTWREAGHALSALVSAVTVWPQSPEGMTV